MTAGVLNIGVTGLRAAQIGLYTTGHNIANASTPGYSRQEALQAAAPALASGAGFIGQGTVVETVRRVYSDFLAHQALSTASTAAELERQVSSAARIDELLADPSAGLAPSLDAFYRALSAANANPADPAARATLLGAAQALAGRFNALDGELEALRRGTGSQISAAVDNVNGLARSLAALNADIVRAQGATGHAPNDLLDRRDALLSQLAQQVGITVVKREDGAANVFVGSGQPLVMGEQAFSLTAVASASDPGKTLVGYATPGADIELPEGALRGGTLGGLLEFQRSSLAPARAELGRIAVVLADAFNAQHRLGQTLSGAMGGALFSIDAPQAIANARNTGSAVVQATLADASALAASDYRLSYDGTSYTLTRLSDNTQQSFAALPQTVDGISLSVTSGAMAAGDEFLIRAVSGMAGSLRVVPTDDASLALASPIRGAASGNAGIESLTVNGPPPVDANLRETVTITFTSAGTFDVSGTGTGNPTGVAYAGGAISYNGWTLTLEGTPQAGDVIVVQANSGGAADNRNGLALAALATQPLVGGTATLSAAYGQMVARAGSQSASLRISAEAQKSLAAHAERERDALSGVNLDEEAAKLMRYQQAYQASAKVIQLAAELFDSILRIGG